LQWEGEGKGLEGGKERGRGRKGRGELGREVLPQTKIYHHTTAYLRGELCLSIAIEKYKEICCCLGTKVYYVYTVETK